MAEKARKEFIAFTGQKTNSSTMYSYWARLIEVLHCAEVMKELLNDPDLLGDDLVRKGTITDTMLNQVEVAIRACDPCLSCATQSMDKMP